MMPELFRSVCETIHEKFSETGRLSSLQVQHLVVASFGYGSLTAFQNSGANDLSLLALTSEENPSYFLDRPHSKFKQFFIDEDRLEKRCSEIRGLSEPLLDPSFFSTLLVNALNEVSGVFDSTEISDDEPSFIQRLSVLADSALRDDSKLLSRYREITLTPLNRLIRSSSLKETNPFFQATFEALWCEKSKITWPGAFATDFVRDECTIYMKRIKPRVFVLEQMTLPNFKVLKTA